MSPQIAAAEILRAVGDITVTLGGRDVRVARRLFRAALGTTAMHPSANAACVRLLRALERLRTSDLEVELVASTEDLIGVGLSMRMLARATTPGRGAEQLERVGLALFDAARAACKAIGAPPAAAADGAV